MKAMTMQLNNSGQAHQIVGEPELFDVLFTEASVNNYRDFVACDNDKKNAFNCSLKLHGILKSPNKLYVSLALTDDDIEMTIDAISHSAISILNG
jgi:glutamate-1-semialdehyde 2,1-aminomutase